VARAEVKRLQSDYEQNPYAGFMLPPRTFNRYMRELMAEIAVELNADVRLGNVVRVWPPRDMEWEVAEEDYLEQPKFENVWGWRFTPEAEQLLHMHVERRLHKILVAANRFTQAAKRKTLQVEDVENAMAACAGVCDVPTK
jgi:histone H3/H4